MGDGQRLAVAIEDGTPTGREWLANQQLGSRLLRPRATLDQLDLGRPGQNPEQHQPKDDLHHQNTIRGLGHQRSPSAGGDLNSTYSVSLGR